MRKWYPVAVVAAAALASALLYDRLPDQMPMHWNMHGEVDRYGSRLEGAFLLPAIMAAMAVLMPVLPRARPNWMFGIRTPWTLSNERVWERTHRFGGYLMFAAGVVVLVGALIVQGAASSWLIIASVLATSIGSMAYSYVAWRQENRS